MPERKSKNKLEINNGGIHLVFRDQSFDDVKRVFKDVYERQNSRYKPQEILNRLIEEIAELVQPALTLRKTQIERRAPDIVAWVCAYANRENISIDKAMWDKYGEKPPGKGKTTLDTFKILPTGPPRTFEDWQKYLYRLYELENENNPPDIMLNRILEDAGTASREVRKTRNLEAVTDKLAGILGWTIALTNKFDIDLAGATWSKYPSECWNCHTKPCRCFSLTTVFIGYTKDTINELDIVKNLLKEELKLDVKAFPEFNQDFSAGRMEKALEAIDDCDGGVILCYKHFSPRVYTELMYMNRTMDKNNVWVCARESTEREKDLDEILNDLKIQHKIISHQDEKDIADKLKPEVERRLEELKRIS